MSKQNKKLAQVRVASPCTAEWDEMRGNDQVRFCEHCAKHVHNLSAMTPRRAQRLVEMSDGNLCVRYYPRPNGAPNISPKRLYPLQRQVSRLAAGAFTAVISVTANLPVPVAAATSPAARATQSSWSRYQTHAADGNARLTGVIKSDDEEKPEPIPRALVRLINRETNERYETTSNEAGEFTLENLPAGTYRMLVKADDYDKYRDKAVTISGGEAKRLDISLSHPVMFMGGVGLELEAAVMDERHKLLEAVRYGDNSQARQLIASGQVALNRSGTQKNDFTLLGLAVNNANYEITRLLLDAGVNIGLADDEGRTILMQLDSDATPELVKLLLKHGASVKQRDDEGRTVLHHVVYKVKPEVLAALIKAGAEVNAQADEGETPLMLAAGDGSLEAIKLLLNAGANLRAVDDDGSLAWHFLGEATTPELIKFFLNAGIDIEQRDNAGATLLLLLAGYETEALATLIKSGANVNAANREGLTPLMAAAMAGQTENIKSLLTAGAIVNASDNDGMTPLIMAAQNHQTEIARLLLKAGAEINARDNRGHTALSYALTDENEDMVKLLKRKGGVGEPIPPPAEDSDDEP